MTTKIERDAVPRKVRDPRHRAREVALQMLYQWEVGRVPMAEVRDTFWTDGDASVRTMSEKQRAFAMRLAGGAADRVKELDPVIIDAAEHWRIERMNVMDRLILRLAVFEFLHEPATPGKVIISEAIELARTFSSDDAVPFVNGVLDTIRRRLERV